MNSSQTILSLFSVVLLLSLTTSTTAQKVTPGSRYQAALCIVKWKKCTRRNARLSQVCKLNRKPWQQPLLCRQRACDFCKYFGPSDTIPCMSSRMKYVCKYLLPSKRRYQRPKPTYPQKKKPTYHQKKKRTTKKKTKTKKVWKPFSPKKQKNMYRCTWTGKASSIVIDLGKVYNPAKGWTHIRRNHIRGLVYEKSKGVGIDPAGKHGKMCFKVRPKYSGSYFYTAVSYAEHWTEHNDLWTMSTKGFRHYKWNSPKMKFVSGPRTWLKAYQNNGPAGMSSTLSTKDHDSHTFVVPNVEKGKVFSLCISGRSFRYEVFRLVLVHCPNNQDMCKYGDAMKLPVSPCV